MPKVAKVRPVLLSAPYAHADPESNLEVRLHLPGGWRTTGLVEITLDDGVVGLGEGYLAVFAPQVFLSMVELVRPLLIGREPAKMESLMRDLATATGYWSLQGAARHVISAVEIALQDCMAQIAGKPLWKLLGAAASHPLEVYASGGDSIQPSQMHREIEQVASLGIRTFKIRARKHQVDKVTWCQREGGRRGIEIAVDMAQNLAVPSQTLPDVLEFLDAIEPGDGSGPAFVEEVLGPDQIANLPELRRRTSIPVAGGEIVTTPQELCERVCRGCYGIVQPDATVIGGVGAVAEVFTTARQAGVSVYVHCWGGAVGMLANYHAALACGGQKVEWPLPAYPLRDVLLKSPLQVRDGKLQLGDTPGLGTRLTPEIEEEFRFRPEAIYHCLVNPAMNPVVAWV
jgi:L-alanine-DL-glutamate epimerase-like enolase superfamily enzyme